ncbi:MULTISPECIES: heavy-metal-associated domain-containing protein [unclassified Serinicoccus]|uniref:heavy-metal-associated domain-containing protein n=1 Tax=unclassified Serinicoccus TaxID=2643101 RepID=UPI003854470D
MQTTTITVSGMTCGHCTSAVTEELTALDGVGQVRIDNLVKGGDTEVAIDSTQPLDPDAVRAAVEEAGYSATL